MKNLFEKLSQLGKRKQHKSWKWNFQSYMFKELNGNLIVEKMHIVGFFF